MKLSVNSNISSVFALAFKDQSIEEKELNKFITEFKRLYERINSKESEENQKNIIADFLKDVYYKPNYEVNTKGRIDLAIHNGKSAKDSVGVIIEAKKPSNKSEMATVEKPNVKAFQEILLYYLDERIKGENIEIKHLIITNIADWFIIDAQDFEKIITKEIIKSYKSFTEGALVNENNVIFYNEIAKNFFDKCNTDLPCTKLNLEIISKLVNSENEKDIEELTHYYKLLSPQHLLKLRFANDSNKLNNDFYNELLHIIGLNETAEGGKKIIDRKPEKDRNDGSLIENTITILKNRNKLQNITNLEQFGETEEKQLFSVGLELCIIWLNRILFLKLLEGQLIKYNNDDREAFSFLNSDKIKDFDELDELFFEVLAIKAEDRPKEITKKFGNIPYLNSSLFEQTELEQKVLEINGIKDRYELEIYSSTVLKDGDKRKTGTLSTLKYLFDFLDAYDFASDKTKKIQTERKTIINASVLGLIFEKINGYKDGSFYTPGFITEYMCRETIRKAVIRKFNDAKKWEHENWNELQRAVVKLSVVEANKIINEVRMCDPAVGSGHFLVSALNEMIAIKQDLQIFEHEKYGPFRGLTIKIENDELVTRLNGELFQYNYKDENSQRIQESLFKEKRTVIENCLFGVDINPKSVMICQLRLWIELLKNAYYIQDNSGKPINKDLQTLPNIDINIKCGNSLVSRFKVRDGFFENSKKFKTKFNDYKIWVNLYKDTNDKKAKAELSKKIDAFKTEFKNIESTDIKAKQKKIDDLAYQLYNKYNSDQLFGSDITDKQLKEKNKLESDLQKLIDEKNDSLNNPLYANALEWRFEFPEILNEDGDFVGFDLVIGNPPYGVKFENNEKEFFKNTFQSVHVRTPESYNYFIKQFSIISSEKALCCLIVPSSFLNQAEFEKTRQIILSNYSPFLILNLGDGVFEDVATPTCIIGFDIQNTYKTAKYEDLTAIERRILPHEIQKVVNSIEVEKLKNNQSYSFIYRPYTSILDKCYNGITTLKDIAEDVATGISPGLGEAFVIKIEDAKKMGLENEIIKKLVIGGEINRYELQPKSDKGIIYFTNKMSISDFPETEKHLSKYKSKLENRVETKSGAIPWYVMLRPRRQKLFEEPKILIRQTANRIIAAYDNEKWYCLKSGIIIQLPSSSELTYKYLVGILNSSLMDFLYNDLVNEDNRIFPEVKPIQLFKLPIKIADESTQRKISILVDKIITLKREGKDTSDIEKELNNHIFEIYGLTDAETEVIKENTKK